MPRDSIFKTSFTSFKNNTSFRFFILMIYACRVIVDNAGSLLAGSQSRMAAARLICVQCGIQKIERGKHKK